MTPNESLIALLAAIYLSDCWYFIPHRSVVFRSPFLRAWSWTRTKSWLGTDAGGCILLQVLPPLGRHLVCDFWPLAFDRDRALSRDTARSPLAAGQHASVSISPDALAELRCEGKRMRLRKTVIARAASNRNARRLTALLHELAAMRVEERRPRIDLEIAQGFDRGRIERMRDLLARSGAPLLLACNLLFVFLAAILPLSLWQIGIVRAWIVLLAVLIALQAWVVFQFVRAHRELFPEEVSDRRWELIQMALSPPVAIRAHDALSRDAFAEFHPVAVASVLTPGPALEALAKEELRECRFGARRRNLPPAAAVTRAWFDERVFDQTEKLLASQGIAAQALLSAPEQAAGTLTSCPMCDTQFSVAEGVCEDCGGIPLIASPARSPSR